MSDVQFKKKERKFTKECINQKLINGEQDLAESIWSQFEFKNLNWPVILFENDSIFQNGLEQPQKKKVGNCQWK